ncbi:MAG TPA: VanZ family protein [Thermoleophilaceae bacterium]
MTLLRRLDPWAWPLLLMASIFFFSAQPDLNSGLGTIDLVGRKLIHFAQNALLAYLWWRALRTRMSVRGAALAAFVITSAYAATDELHQTFVHGRHGSPVDWAIDTAGAALASARLARRREPSEARH